MIMKDSHLKRIPPLLGAVLCGHSLDVSIKFQILMALSISAVHIHVYFREVAQWAAQHLPGEVVIKNAIRQCAEMLLDSVQLHHGILNVYVQSCQIIENAL